MFLSFIIPAYNAEKFIINTLTSISQEIRTVSTDEIEIIIINDGSVDNTPLLVEDFIKNNTDLNIKLFSKENGGLSDARNYGIDKASFDYIWFFDSDDLIEQYSLSKIITKIKFDKLDLLSIGIRDCYCEKHIKIESNIKNKPTTNVVDAVSYLKFYKIEHSACCYIFKRSISIENSIYFLQGVLSEDYDFTWRLIEKCKRISSLGEIAYNYQIANGSLSRRKNEDFYRFHHISMIKILNHTNNYLINLENENKTYKEALLPYYSQLKIIALIVLLKSTIPIQDKLTYFIEFKKNKVLDIVIYPKVFTFTWKEIIIILLVKLNLYLFVLKLVSKS